MATEAQIAYWKRKSEMQSKQWKDPEYRKKMLEKQLKIGYRQKITQWQLEDLQNTMRNT